MILERLKSLWRPSETLDEVVEEQFNRLRHAICHSDAVRDVLDPRTLRENL